MRRNSSGPAFSSEAKRQQLEKQISSLEARIKAKTHEPVRTNLLSDLEAARSLLKTASSAAALDGVSRMVQAVKRRLERPADFEKFGPAQ